MQCSVIKTLVSLLGLITWLHSSYLLANEWQLEKQNHHVSVYSQETESGYKKVLAKTLVEAHPQALIALLDDISISSQWIHNCIEVKLIEKASTTERLVHSFFNAPWPVKNRDMVTYSKTSFIGQSIQIEIFDKASHIKDQPNFVRMQDMHGLWTATPTESGKVEITYSGGGNPGGNIPSFIADRELISSMFNTFTNLIEIISADKYQPTKLLNDIKT